MTHRIPHHLVVFVLAAAMAILPCRAADTSQSARNLQFQPFGAVLLGEIALQRGMLADSWRAFMDSARATGDERLAERSWEIATMMKDHDLAGESLSLWDHLDPENSHAALLAVEEAAHGKGSLDDAGKILSAALKKSDEPGELLSRALESARPIRDKKAFYNWLLPIAGPYGKNARAQLVLARAARDAGRLSEASTHAKTAYDLEPLDPQIVLESADIEYPYKPSATSERLQLFLKSNPDNIHLRLAYARSLQRSATPDRVLAEIKAIDRMTRESPHSQFALGMIAEDSGLYEQAELFYKRHLVLIARSRKKTLPADSAYVRLGMVKLAQGHPELAVEWFNRVEKGDQYVAARLRQAELLGQLDRVDEACSVLRGLRAPSQSDRARFCSACAALLVKKKRPAEALEPLKEAIEATPDDADLLYRAGMAADAAGNVQEAEKMLTRAAELAPSNASVHNGLGYILADRNMKLEKAAAHIEKAMRLSGGREAFIVDSLGWLRYRQGRLEDAERELRRALAMTRDDEVALHLAEVLFAMGRKDEAAEIARPVLRSEEFSVRARQLLDANGMGE